jgi:hypothetical protein
LPGRRRVAHVDADKKFHEIRENRTEIIADFQVAAPGMRPIFFEG